jgi:hypothetical protein
MSDKKDDKWEMPPPVFRTSAGSLPKTLEDTISHSFMPNSDTIEIDHDDDILSVMDTTGKDNEAKISEFTGGETIFNIGTGVAFAAEAPATGDGSTAEADQKPLAVTANEPVGVAVSNSDNAKSNLMVYIVVALIVAGIITAVMYYQASATS